MAMSRRAALLWFTWCSGLFACSEGPDGRLPTTPLERPTSRADAPLDASVASSQQTSSEPIDAQPDAGAAVIVGYPFLGRYLINARDLGGIRLPGAARVAPDRLFRGPLLAPLPGNGCDAFASTGVRTVVELRMPSETASQPDATCVGEHAQIVLAPLPTPITAGPEEYVAMLDVRDSISTFFRVLGDPSAYPVYFHCSWGRDRTGVAAALVLLVLGAARQDIMQDYLLSRRTGGVTPEPLDATLDEIERRGGIEAYLGTIGVSADNLDALRHAAIEPLP